MPDAADVDVDAGQGRRSLPRMSGGGRVGSQGDGVVGIGLEDRQRQRGGLPRARLLVEGGVVGRRRDVQAEDGLAGGIRAGRELLQESSSVCEQTRRLAR